MVYRVYVEKKPEFANEARSLCAELRGLLGITALEDVRIICRYDAEDIDAELFDYATRTFTPILPVFLVWSHYL